MWHPFYDNLERCLDRMVCAVIIGIAGAVFLFCGLVILSVRSVKYDLLPLFREFQNDPAETPQTRCGRL